MNDQSHELAELEKTLGHEFADRALIERALTHSSSISPARRTEHSYQRLEFLGDRVLGLAVADLLHKRLPEANEGDLSRTLNALVRKETCTEIAIELDLGPHIRLGDSEARSGGAEKSAILADVAEAVIGAIYMDGGFKPAFRFVERFFGKRIDAASRRRADAKTALQEWAQAQGLAPPSYALVKRSGPDHAPHFEIAVRLADYPEVTAKGASKKTAEHKAAEQFLVRERVWEKRA